MCRQVYSNVRIQIRIHEIYGIFWPKETKERKKKRKKEKGKEDERDISLIYLRTMLWCCIWCGKKSGEKRG